MIVYVSLIIYSVILSLIYVKASKTKGQEKSLKILQVLIALPAFLVMALRYDVGIDYKHTYQPVFEVIRATGAYSNIDFGFVLLNRLVLIFTTDYAGIFILTSFLFSIFTYKAIYQNSKNVPLSVFIMIASSFYFLSMNIVRQAITITIFLYALKFIKERKFWPYLITILIATSFHRTALLYLPIYFLAHINLKPRYMIALVIITIIGLPVIIDLIEIIVAGSKYERYLNGIWVVQEEGVPIGAFVNICWLLLCLILTMLDNKKNVVDKELLMYKNIHFIGVLTTCLIGSIPLAGRLFTNFYHIQILSIPFIISKIENKKYRALFIAAVVIYFSILFIVNVGMRNGNGVLPYQTIFNR